MKMFLRYLPIAGFTVWMAAATARIEKHDDAYGAFIRQFPRSPSIPTARTTGETPAEIHPRFRAAEEAVPRAWRP